MTEFANNSRTNRTRARSPENIPEFRAHLARTGQTYAEWRARQTVPDATTDALRLAARRAKLKR